MSRVITSEEVTKHNDKESVWMVIRNDVYDVTSFLEEHPGGEETLLEVAGQDGTRAFDDVGHSEDARELLKKFKIGSLPPGDKMPDSKYHARPKFRYFKFAERPMTADFIPEIPIVTRALTLTS